VGQPRQQVGAVVSKQKRDWIRVASGGAPWTQGVDPPGFPQDREEFERGYKGAVLWVIYICATSKWRIPQWAADAFSDMCWTGWRAKAKSWDDVFGKPYHGQQRTARNETQATWVWAHVKKLRMEESVPVTNELFERVGNEFGMSRSVVSKLYYRVEGLLEGISPERRKKNGIARLVLFSAPY
jgi:hypothetical protein